MRSLVFMAMLGLIAVVTIASVAKSNDSPKGLLVYYTQGDQKLAQRREATPPKLIHLAWLRAGRSDGWSF
ncbi:MAG TPA: hypothetical protein VL402_08775 [Xanthobacteraceae bacterium]|jgi:hypothetical protein|nr:hypothetical protein [Xanthobacteraceae bacterium]